MLTLRDHHTGSLFDPWSHLGAKRKRLLERSWAGVFRKYLLEHLPVEEFASHFCEGFGRPSKDLHVACGALILQQLHDLTDRQTVEALAFNITWHYALDIRRETDAYICERTLRNYRRLVIEQGLDEVLFCTLTDKLIASVGTDTAKQRLDSTAVRSYMRTLTRLGIIVESISKFLRELKRTYPELFEDAGPRLWQQYVDREGEGCFASTRPSESKRRLPEAVVDLYGLVSRFRDTEAAKLESFAILKRVFEEQCEVAGEGAGDGTSSKDLSVQVKAPRDIPCDGVLNPADPDASYNAHRGVGYRVQLMETFSDRGDGISMGDSSSSKEEYAGERAPSAPDLVTYVSVEKMTDHDGSALAPALEDTTRRGVRPEELLADTHYGSADGVAHAKRKGVDLVAPAMTAKGKRQGKLTLEDFKLDDDGCIERCPEGHAPLETQASKTRLQATFDASICKVCPVRKRCVAFGKDRYQYTHDRVQTRKRRLAEAQPAFEDRYRWRAGIEGSISRYKHQMNMNNLRIRGEAAVRYTAMLRALGLNIFRVTAWNRNATLNQLAID